MNILLTIKEVIDAIKNLNERLAVRNVSLQQLLSTAVYYRIHFVSTLVKLGYIPREIARLVTSEGKLVIAIPSVTEYLNYIYTEEGYIGFIRGEFVYLSSALLYSLVDNYIQNRMKKSLDTRNQNQCGKILKDIFTVTVSNTIAILVTQPLDVLSIRQMAQFIGKENIYSNIGGVKNLFLKPGIWGIFDGVIPRCIFIILPIICGKLIIATYDQFIASDTPRSRSNVQRATSFTEHPTHVKMIKMITEIFVKDVLHPLDVIVVSSSVRGSGLVAGTEEFIPDIWNWLSRLRYMSTEHQLPRKANLCKPIFTEHLGAFVVH